MPIYTKTGDDGTTALFGGRRVKKHDAQIEAYGSVDELTSILGLVIAQVDSEKDAELLTDIQKDLYAMMGTLCGGVVDLSVVEKRISLFEKNIDELDKKLPKLTRFILPQGTETAAWFHMARAICRRAERAVVYYFSQSKSLDHANNRIIVQYLNRLSDHLFMMARWHGRGKEIST